MGTIFGFIMFKVKDREFKLRQSVVMLGWLISIGTLMAIIFGPYHSVPQNFGVIDSTAAEASTYEAFSRISWGFALSWIISACHFGYGGKINEFLSHHQWQLLTKLSFAMYLTHMTVQSIIIASSKTSVFFSTFNVVSWQ